MFTQYHIQQMVIKIDSSYAVMSPSIFSLLLANSVGRTNGLTALDVGCGCGLQSIVIAKLGAGHFWAIDVDPRSIEATAINASLNQVADKITVVQGDMFSPFSDRSFDLIVCNPPTLPSDARISRHWWGGTNGREFLNRFLYECPKYLKSKGEIQFVQSSLVGIELSIQQLQKNGVASRVVARDKIGFRAQYFDILNKIEYLSMLSKGQWYEEDGKASEEVVVINGFRP